METISKTDILLLQAPPVWAGRPPLGLAYLSSWLRGKKWEVNIIDLNQEIFSEVPDQMRRGWSLPDDSHERGLYSYWRKHSPHALKRIINQIEISEPSLLGLSVFRSNFPFTLSLADHIRRAFPNLPIVFGGAEALYQQHTDFKYFPEKGARAVDAWVVGEGELPLHEALTGLKANLSLTDCLDFSTNQYGHLVFPYMEVEDLSKLPSPTFEEFDLGRYTHSRNLPLLASRGCIRRCAFCAECLLSLRYRSRSASDIIKEMNAHLYNYGVRHFSFHDSIFNGDLKQLEELCLALIEENLPITWEAQIAVRKKMTGRLFGLMKKAGCVSLFVGLESGSDHILSLMNKGFTVAEAETFIKKAHRHGPHFEISMIVDYPGEGLNEFEETLEFLRRNASQIRKLAQVNPYVALPGTPSEKTYPSKGAYNRAFSLSSTGREKVNRITDLCEELEIKFTPAFVNNLVQNNG